MELMASDTPGDSKLIQSWSMVPGLLPATIESANESPLREQHNNNPSTTTTKQGTHVEAIRLQQLNRNMKRPSPHHIDHGVLYVFDAHSLGLCNAHTFTFFTECVVDYLIALSLESCAQIGIWFTRNAHRGTAGFDLHSQIFRFLLNRGMPEEKLLLLWDYRKCTALNPSTADRILAHHHTDTSEFTMQLDVSTPQAVFHAMDECDHLAMPTFFIKCPRPSDAPSSPGVQSWTALLNEYEHTLFNSLATYWTTSDGLRARTSNVCDIFLHLTHVAQQWKRAVIHQHP